MPSALSRSYSLPVAPNANHVAPNKTSGSNFVGLQKSKMSGSSSIDPKAVGSHLSHRPLSRRGSFSSELQDFVQTQPSFYPLGLTLDDGKRSSSGHRKLERTQSEPNNRPVVANSSRYKTELCRPFEENGSCKYGDKCQFAHGLHELRSLPRHPKYKTELCKTFHTVGFCPYGPRCHFIHNAEEARTNSPSNSSTSSSSSSNSSSNNSRSKKTLPMNLFALGSTAESPSPPSSLSESPTTSASSFFSDDLLPGNPFSPSISSNKNSFFFESDFGTSFFGRSFSAANRYSDYYTEALNIEDLAGLPVKLPGLDSPSPAESLASDLDSLSMGSDSPPPPSTISSPMETSRALRLPIFSRISETSTESEDSN